MRSAFRSSTALPETAADLWGALTAFDGDSQAALFAHCASLAVNVVKEPWNRRPGALAHGDLLAQAVNIRSRNPCSRSDKGRDHPKPAGLFAPIDESATTRGGAALVSAST